MGDNDDSQEMKESMERKTSQWLIDLQAKKEAFNPAGPIKSKCAAVTGFALTLMMAYGYLALFSSMDIELISDNSFSTFIGYGAQVFVLLSGASEFAYYTGAFGVIGVLSLLVLDVQNWTGILRFIGATLMIIFVGALFVTCLLFSESFPSAPFGVYFAVTALIGVFVRKTIFRDVYSYYFIGGVSLGLLLSSLVVLTIWVYWLSEGNEWDVPLKLDFYELLDCPVNFANLTSIDELRLANLSTIVAFFDSNVSAENCEFAFFLWVSPLVFVACSLPFSAVFYFITKAELDLYRYEKPVTVDPVAQVFMVLITLSIMGMWVAASIAAATSSVSNTILAFSLLAFVGSVGIALGTFGISYMKSQLVKTPLGKAAFEFAKGDWGKSFVVVTMTPLALLFLFLNFLQQLVRKYTCLGKTLTDKDEKRAMLTSTVSKAYSEMNDWDWGSVYIKALYWGILFFTVVVGVARITTVFLSYLRLELEAIDLGLTIAIFVTVGIIMFLLPPVPGVPVYIAGGIIVTSKTEADFGFIGGLLFTLMICFGLKMTAIFMQQKLIGELFGARSVYIRSLVSINSDTLKAMKIILSKPGLHISKVVILIGGPDWPTSVLTGIMRLPLCQMLLGSVPVIFLIAPCVVSGAMLVKASEGGIYTSLNTVSITLTFVIQSMSMLGAMHFLAKKVKENQDEINAMPNDKEVEKLDEKSATKRAMTRDWGAWKNLGCALKMGHRIAVVLMIASCYMFQLLGKQIFVTYDITDTIDEALDGNVVNLVKRPFGLIPLGCFALSCVYLIVFTQIRKYKVNKLYSESQSGGSTETVTLEI